MPERSAAFALKSRALPSEVEVIGTEVSPLGELEADQQRVRAFEFYLGKITSNQITSTEELRARLNQKFEAGFGRQGYLASEDGVGLKDSDGQYLQIPRDERILVSDGGDQKVLVELYETFSISESGKAAQSLDFYVNKIIAGGIISVEELEARLNERFKGGIRQGNFYLASADGEEELRTAQGILLKIPPEERFKVTNPKQQRLLIELYGQLDQIISERLQAQGFDYYVKKILSGQITSIQELQARLSQTVEEGYDGGPLLLNQNGQYFADLTPGSNGYIQVKEAERFKVADVAEQQVLLGLYDLINNSRIPTEVKDLIKIYARDGKQVDFERLNNLLSERGETPLSVANFVENLGLQRRRASLKTAVYETLSTRDSEPVFGLLTAFDNQSAEDRTLVVQLTNEALAIRRLNVIKDFSASLIGSTAIDQALLDIDVLLKSPVTQDVAFALTLVEVAYQQEFSSIKDQIRAMVKVGTNPDEIYRFIDELSGRAPLGEFDYVEFLKDLKKRIGVSYVGITGITRVKNANEIRSRFSSSNVDDILVEIGDLPNETVEERAVKSQLFTLYKNYVAVNKSEVFDERFAREIVERIEARLKEVFINPDLGRNKEAFKFMKRNFDNVFRPLIQSFQDDPRTKRELERVLGSNETKLRFIQKLSELEKQRPVTDLERSYIQSVELLTLFNPYLLALLNADSAVTSEYLRHHFNTISAETKRELKDGDYVPLIQIGTGPNGLAALGEVVRNNPDLASQMLIIDSGEQPGGPFAVPRGPAWKLNSANSRGEGGYILPSPPNGSELRTVRAYGSPFRWYPGERITGSSARFGSINTTVDYLPSPDELSLKNYPTNEELQVILALQTAILARRIALKTSVVSVEPNPVEGDLGDKIVTLRMDQPDGSQKLMKIKTNAVFNATGLGEPQLGFRLEGSRAEQILEQTKDSTGFPKLSTTLEAFRALADRSGEKKSPGRTIVLLGSGNSTDVLIEFIGRIFEGDNPNIREVTKVIFAGESDPSQRPRYAAIRDLRSRNGSENLVDQIKTRVSDIGFATDDGNPQDRKLVLYDNNGNVILDNGGRPILVDSVISAAGFRPALEGIFASYIKGRSFKDQGPDAPLSPLTLPTNPEVAVADYFVDDPTIVLLGTSSRDGFKSLEKRSQLPEAARNALLRNGVENAVAIGFRAPDTQAAVNIWLNSRDVNLEPKPQESIPQLPLEGNNPPNTQMRVEKVASDNLQIPDNITDEDLLLSPILAYNIARGFQLSEKFNGNLDFELTFNQDEGSFVINFKGGDVQGVSTEVLTGLIMATTDVDFQRYALSLLGKRRRDPKLDLNIAFRRGRINPQNTFVQTA